jgi:hypothetical protein
LKISPINEAPSLLFGGDEALEFLEPVLDEDHFVTGVG